MISKKCNFLLIPEIRMIAWPESINNGGYSVSFSSGKQHFKTF